MTELSPCCEEPVQDAECPDCDGSGEIDNEVCEFCNGNGLNEDYYECSACWDVFDKLEAVFMEDE